MSEMVSFGAGQNSTALVILMVNEGWRGHVVFADPGAEHPDTYCFLTYFERIWLKPRGVELVRLSPATHPELYCPSYRMTLIEKCELKHIVPIIMNRWCTAEYKRTPLTRWAKAHDVAVQYLGISAEESRRASIAEREGISLEYPLIDRSIDRAECRRIIQREGLSVPPKSGCWICPFQTLAEWRELYNLRPDLFDKAAELDSLAIAKMREKRANPFEGQLAQKHHHSLAELLAAWEGQIALPLMPDPVYEYQMCECRL